jgi:hypothetical protein
MVGSDFDRLPWFFSALSKNASLTKVYGIRNLLAIFAGNLRL